MFYPLPTHSTLAIHHTYLGAKTWLKAEIIPDLIQRVGKHKRESEEDMETLEEVLYREDVVSPWRQS